MKKNGKNCINCKNCVYFSDFRKKVATAALFCWLLCCWSWWLFREIWKFWDLKDAIIQLWCQKKAILFGKNNYLWRWSSQVVLHLKFLEVATDGFINIGCIRAYLPIYSTVSKAIKIYNSNDVIRLATKQTYLFSKRKKFTRENLVAWTNQFVLNQLKYNFFLLVLWQEQSIEIAGKSVETKMTFKFSW